MIDVSLLTNPIFVALVVIFIAIVTALLVLCARIWRWRQQSGDQSRRTRSELAAVRNDMVKARREMDRYPPTDPEPYGPIAGELEQILGDVRETYPQLVKQLNDLTATPVTSPDDLARLLSILWHESRYWRQCIEGFVALDASVRELRAQMDKVALLLAELHEMPHKVARQNEELEQAIESSLKIARKLDASGVHGDAVGLATVRVHQLQADLLALPPCFLRGSKGLAIDQASKKT